MTPDGLEAFYLVMRRHGVTKFAHDGVSIEMAATAEPLNTKDFVAGTFECHCGHTGAEHGDHGLCLRGCAAEKCEGEGAKA